MVSPRTVRNPLSSPPRASWTAGPAMNSGWPARPWRAIPRSSCTACSGRLRPGSAILTGACGAVRTWATSSTGSGAPGETAWPSATSAAGTSTTWARRSSGPGRVRRRTRRVVQQRQRRKDNPRRPPVDTEKPALISAGVTKFPISPEAPRNNNEEELERFMAPRCEVSADPSKTLYSCD